MIRIVIPYYTEFEAVKPGLRDMRKAGIPFEYYPSRGPVIMTNRNLGVTENRSQKIFQEPPAHISHFLFVDSDIGFDAAHVRAALAHNKPILALPYLRHENDGLYQAGDFGDEARSTLNRFHVSTVGLLELDFVGAGFLLVKREVLAGMRYPWFRHDVVEIGDEADNRGEDVCFCIGAFEAGIPIYCDFDHPVRHRLRRQEDFDVSI